MFQFVQFVVVGGGGGGASARQKLFHLCPKNFYAKKTSGIAFFGNEQQSSILDIKKEPDCFDSPLFEDSKAPWLFANGVIKRGNLQDPSPLHSEILSFSKYIAADKYELAARGHIQKTLQRCIREAIGQLSSQNRKLPLWFKLLASERDQVKLQFQGSMASNTTIPSSDIDLIVVAPESLTSAKSRNWNSYRAALEMVRKAKNRTGVHRVLAGIPERLCSLLSTHPDIKHRFNLRCLAYARVPIIKVFDAKTETGLSSDICFLMENGIYVAEEISHWSKQFPAFLPVFHLLKYYLESEKMNDPSQGYLGSYAISLMLRHILLRAEHTDQSLFQDLCDNADLLLLNFLHFYGNQFDSKRYAITFRGRTLLDDSRKMHSAGNKTRPHHGSPNSQRGNVVNFSETMAEPFFVLIDRGNVNGRAIVKGSKTSSYNALILEDPYKPNNNVTNCVSKWHSSQVLFRALFQNLMNQLGILHIPRLEWHNVIWIQKDEILDLAKPFWFGSYKSYLERSNISFNGDIPKIKQHFESYCKRHSIY